MKRTITIIAEMRSYVSARDFAEYVKEAVNGWSGAFHIDDERKSIEVVEVKRAPNEADE